MDPKPGFLTSEFWLSAVHKVLSFAITAGFLTSQAATQWETALAGVVAIVFVVLASWGVTVTYTGSRTLLKDAGSSTTPLVVLLALLLLAPAAPAQSRLAASKAGCPCSASCACGCQAGKDCHCLQKTSLLPWRQRRNQEHQALRDRVSQLESQQRQAPSPPQVIVVPQPPSPVLTPPLQTIPLGGAPLQTIPLGGVPHQVIPLGGVPHVLIPLGEAPKQQIPLGGPPKQKIDDGGKPKNEIPLGKEPPPIMPRVEGPTGTGPTHNHQYSRAYALYRP